MLYTLVDGNCVHLVIVYKNVVSNKSLQCKEQIIQGLINNPAGSKSTGKCMN